MIARIFLLLTFPLLAQSAPTLEADLIEMDSLGHEIVTFEPRSLVKYPKAFSLREGRLETQFRITRVRKSECGSVRYQATDSRGRRWLELTDHTNRTCLDYHKYKWDVRVTDRRRVRLYYGNPKPVMPPLVCLEGINTMCIMVYAPATCLATTLDGGRTPIPRLEAKGSNSCHATVALQTAACAAGYSLDRLTSSDIQCSFDGVEE